MRLVPDWGALGRSPKLEVTTFGKSRRVYFRGRKARTRSRSASTQRKENTSKRVDGLLPEIHGWNLALTVQHVPYSLNSRFAFSYSRARTRIPALPESG